MIPNSTQELPTRPLLKSWYRAAQCGSEAIFQYDRTIVFNGMAVLELFPVLLPLLDGTHTLEEICVIVGEAVEPATRKALAMLHERGLLLDGTHEDDPAGTYQAGGMETFLSATSGTEITPSVIRRTLQSRRIVVYGRSSIAREIIRILEAMMHLRVDSGELEVCKDLKGDTSMLAVVAPASEELPALIEWNRAAIESSTSWFLVQPFDGQFARVGPLVLPGRTACYACLQARRWANLPFGDAHAKLDAVGARYPQSSALDAVIAGLAGHVLTRWIAGTDSLALAPGRYYALEPGLPVRMTDSVVLRVPRCPQCSPVRSRSTPFPWFAVRVGYEAS